LLRHAEDALDLWEPPGSFNRPVSELPVPPSSNLSFWDAGLTEHGLRQLLPLQKYFAHEVGLARAHPESVQLAAGLQVRAFDSLVIACAPLWRKWRAANVSFQVHGIPAAMELDAGPNDSNDAGIDGHLRKPGVAVDDPVRWKDSVLAGGLSALAKADDARELFYQAAEDLEKVPDMTTKPVQVQAYVQRVYHGARATTRCNESESIVNLNKYLEMSKRAGKRHIVLSTSGSTAHCVLQQFVSHPIHNKDLLAASVVHLRLRGSNATVHMFASPVKDRLRTSDSRPQWLTSIAG